MERLFSPDDIPESKPDKSGETNTSKKKAKRPARVPLGGRKEIIKTTEENKEKPPVVEKSGTQPELFSVKDGEETAPAQADQELVLPEVAAEQDTGELSLDPEFLGELKITHQDTPEQPAEPQVESIPETEPEASPEQPGETEEVSASEQAFDHEQGSEVLDEPQAQSEKPPRVAPPLIFSLSPEVLGRREAAQSEQAAQQHANNQLLEPASPNLNDSGTMFNPSRRVTADRQPVPTAPMVTEKEARRRTYRARKYGVSRGVVAGGLAGYLWGRRGKNSLAKQADSELKSRDKTIEQLTEARTEERNLSETRHNILKRTQEELNRILKHDWETKFIRRKNTTAELPEGAVVTARKPEKPAPALEKFTPAYESLTNEKIKEKTTPAAKEVKKPTAKLPESPEDKPITEKTYLSREGRRIETSAWHRMEIDNKTNRIVEDPDVEYGEAFQREQSQEKLARNAAKAQTAAQLGVAVVGGGVQSSTSVKQPDLNEPAKKSIEFPDLSKPFKTVTENSDYIVQQLVKQTTSPLVWLAAFGIVVLLFALGILN